MNTVKRGYLSSASSTASADVEYVSIIDCQMVNRSAPVQTMLSTTAGIMSEPEYYFDEDSGQIILLTTTSLTAESDQHSTTSSSCPALADTLTLRFADENGCQTAVTDNGEFDNNHSLPVRVKIYQCARCFVRFERSYQLNRHMFIDHSDSGAAIKKNLFSKSPKNISNSNGISNGGDADSKLATYASSAVHHQPLVAAAASIRLLMPPADHPIKICQRTKFDTAHIGYNASTKCYECKLCFAQTVRLADMDVHLVVHNGTPFVHQCELCDEQLPSLQVLQNHVHAHTCLDWSHRCPQCHRRFASVITQQAHVCDGKMKPTCVCCRQTFASWLLLTAHQHYVHGDGRKQFQCETCGLAFVHQPSLSVHWSVECAQRLSTVAKKSASEGRK